MKLKKLEKDFVDKLELLSADREREHANLLDKIKGLVPDICWYGVDCKRKFCSFSHEHVNRKDNRVFENPKNQDFVGTIQDGMYLCEVCGIVPIGKPCVKS